MKTILITGAAGFVGSHVVEACLRKNWTVFGADDFSTGLLGNIAESQKNRKFKLLKIDLSLPHAAKRIIRWISALKLKKPDTVIDLVAKKIPRYGGRLDTLVTNVHATETACNIAAYFNAKLVFASTSDVYGLSHKLPFREHEETVFGTSTVARWSYGSSKYLGEQLVWGYHEQFDVPIVILRIFGVYGPRQVKGWKGNAVSAFFEQALADRKMELHGNGKQTRSFVYIDDLVEGIMKAITRESANNRIINIGNLEEIMMRALAKKIYKLVGGKGKPKYKLVEYASFTGKEYQDIMAKLPDLSLAKKYLNWSPKTSLEDGLKRTADWYLTSR